MRAILGFAVAGAALALASFSTRTREARAEASQDPQAIIELGRRLFFDPAVSRSGSNSCAACHDPEHGWSSSKMHDEDDFVFHLRHTPTLVDVASRTGLMHVDGEWAVVEQLIDRRLGVFFDRTTGYGALRRSPLQIRPPADDPTRTPSDPAPKPMTPGDGAGGTKAGAPPTAGSSAEHPTSEGWIDPRLGLKSLALVTFRDDAGVLHELDMGRFVPVADRVEADGRYAEAFTAAFGNSSVTLSRMSTAIAEFCRSLRSTESPFDQYLRGDERAISTAAKRGLALFRGEAGCVRCHRLDAPAGERAPLTDGEFHVTGISARTFGGAGGILEDTREVLERTDVGEHRVSTRSDRMRAFRTASLRDVARRGPFMHDGSLATLEDVVRHYAMGAVPDPHLDPAITGFEISDLGVRDLVELLRSFTGYARAGIAPDFRDRAESTRVRFLDAHGKPLAGMPVRAVPSGDPLPGDMARTSPEQELVTDAEGVIRFTPGRKSHTRLLLPVGLRMPQGEWIPDSCRRLDVTMPVEGRASVRLTIVRPEQNLERLVVTIPPLGERAIRRRTGPERQLPPPVDVALNPRRVTFERIGSAVVGGMTVVRYEAWIPTEAPDEGLVAIPSGTGRFTRPVSLEPGRETRIDLRD